jgi:predicted TIM-barrel fold metal-dependent hydrolase
VRPELQPFRDEIVKLVPDGAEIVDVHTHLGVDEDGRRLDLATLLRRLDEAGIDRACAFALHDPDRVPAYRMPNDRVLAWADESHGRVTAFCRLDPADDPIGEARRCIALGARGIKLHPREQEFAFDGGPMDDVFGFAAETGVPILVHSGRGVAGIADGLCDTALRHHGAPLILAHAGIADQAVFAARLADHPAAFFDTSVLGVLDLVELYARVPAERIVFGSDPPYGKPLLGLYTSLRVAALAGVSEHGMRALLGGTASALLAGGQIPPATSPLRPRTIAVAGSLVRIHRYASAAFDDLRRGDTRTARGTIALALSVCRDPDPGFAGPALERIRPALEAVAHALERPAERVPQDLLHLVASLAATERAPSG